MNISYNWLKKYINTNLEVRKIADILTDVGLEVEGVEFYESVKGGLRGVVIGKIIQIEKHPDADNLKLVQVNLGYGVPLQIVCGAPNIEVGQKVPIATIGTVLHPKNGKDIQINQTKIRGELSHGMICSEFELGVGEDKDGIMVIHENVLLGTPLNEVIRIANDHCIEIGLTPNRTDAMCHYGVARDLNAAIKSKKLDSELIPIDTSQFSVDKKSGNPIMVEIEDPSLCPRYSGVYLKNVSVKQSPEWLQNELKVIGLSPINNIVDITNYILHSYGQPLHAFDADKITGNKIIIGSVEEGTRIQTLDGVERKLSQNDLIIKDANDTPMCIAGIIGGKEHGIDENTRNVFLESAYFTSSSIRKTSKRLGITTDSSFRFERGADSNFTIQALKLACILFKELADAVIIGEVIDQYPNKIEESLVTIRYHKVDQILGKRIHRDKIKEILKSLEIEVLSDTDVLDLRVPTYRVDVTREIDVIEEIARIYGYNNIDVPEKISYTTYVENENSKEEEIENTVANQLKYNGFYEVLNNSITQKRNEDIDTDYVEILNPLSKELSVLRKSLMYEILNNVSYNLNRKQKKIKLFEFGKVYFKINEKYIETRKLAIILHGDYQSENWFSKNTNSSFYHLKGILNQIFQSFGINNIEETPAASSLEFDTSVELKIKRHLVAKIGCIKKKILNNFGIKGAVYYAEIEWNILIKSYLGQEMKNIVNIPKYPGARRDLALLLDKNIKYADLHSEAFNLEQRLLKNVDLFDVYEGEKLPENKKSYALSFYIQNEEKTLTDKEIDEVMDNILEKYRTKFNAELRA